MKILKQNEAAFSQSRHFHNRRTLPRLGLTLSVLLALLARPEFARAQAILWSSSGGSAWLTGNNWTGSAVPTASQIAQFGSNPTGSSGVGINFNNPTTPGPLNQAVGAIEQTSARTSGALVIGNSTSVAGKNGTLTLNGATVNSVANVVVRSASSQNVTIQDTQGGATLTMAVALADATENIVSLDGSGNITFSSVLASSSGTTPLTIAGSGSGRVDITGAANTFTGNIKVSGAEVRFTSTGSLGNSANTVTVDGGRFGIASGGTVDLSARSIFLGSTAGTSISAPGSGGILIYNGALADKSGSTGILVKQGAGALVLGGVNTYSGDTAINNGTVQLTNGNDRLPTGTTLSIGQSASANLGVFDLNGRNQTIAGLNSVAGSNATGAKNAVTSAPPATLTLAASGSYAYGDGTATNSGVIAGAVSLVHSGSGTQTLGDTNTYTGDTTISAGTLALTGNGLIANSTNITIAGGATFDVSGRTATLTLGNSQTFKTSGNGSSGTVATAAGKGLTLGSTGGLQFTAYDGTTAPLTVSGGGSVTLGAGNAVSVTVSGSALSVGDYKLIAKGTGNTTAASGTAPSSVTINGGGLAGGTAGSLVISNGELYLHVQTSCTPPNITTGSQPQNQSTCASGTATFTLTASGDGLAYQWQVSTDSTNFSNVTGGAGASSNSFSTNPIVAANGSEYRCVITGSCGAITSSVATLTVTANVTPAVSVAVNPSATVCAGVQVIFTASPENGGTPSYQWFKNGSQVATGSAYTNSALGNGDQIYVVMTSTDPCRSQDTATSSTNTMTVNPLPVSTITASSSVCANSTNAATVADAGAGATYAWGISGGSITAGQGTTNITYTASTNSPVTLSCAVTNSSGCSSSASTNVPVNALPTATITTASVVQHDSAGHAGSVPDAGAGATYVWTISGGSITAGQGTTNITYSAGSITPLTLGCTVTSSSGCSSVSSANVTVTLAFTPGDLVVNRIGNGTEALNANGDSIFMDEITSSGTKVQSVPVPDSATSALIGSGSAGSEGALMRSPDGSLLCFAGYNTNYPFGSSVSGAGAGTLSRAVGTLDAGAGFTLAATTATQYGGNNFRGAATDGTGNYWGAGASSGTYYLGSGTPGLVQTNIANTRVVNIINGNLYFVTASTAAGTAGIWGFSGTPTTASTATQLFFTGTNTSPYGFAMNSSGTVAYVADDGTQTSEPASAKGIERWDNSGGTWTMSYILGTNVAGVFERGLAVDFSGANPVIYSTTTESSANRLIKITDTGVGSTVTTLATAPSNTFFRGVAFAPRTFANYTVAGGGGTCAGSSATITLSGSESGVGYQLYRNGGLIAVGSPMAGTGSGLTWSSGVTVADTYTVVASDGLGAQKAMSGSATVTVNSFSATNVVYNEPQGLSFKIAESGLLTNASGTGGVTLSSVQSPSANGVTIVRSNGFIFYNGTLTTNDSFNYTVASVTGGCNATATIMINVFPSVGGPQSVAVSAGTAVVQFAGIPNYSYAIQRSTNLVDWVTLVTTNAPGNGVFSFTDTFSDLGVVPSEAYYRTASP